MRRIFVATLLSSLTLTAAAATKPANDAAPAPSTDVTRPISTGVTNPHLVYSTHIDIPAEAISSAFPNPAQVVLRLSLDATGSPTSVQVLQSLTQDIDARIIAAVRQFRWTPAVLDNTAIPVDMKLVVQVQR